MSFFCKCSPPFRGLLRSKNWKLSKNRRVIIHRRWDVAQFWRTPLTDGCTLYYHFEFWKFYLLKLKKSKKSQTTKYTPSLFNAAAQGLLSNSVGLLIGWSCMLGLIMAWGFVLIRRCSLFIFIFEKAYKASVSLWYLGITVLKARKPL